jgi:hypothetical protein
MAMAKITLRRRRKRGEFSAPPHRYPGTEFVDKSFVEFCGQRELALSLSKETPDDQHLALAEDDKTR